MAKYSIGLDYGTLSARAILVDIETGETIAQSIYPYPHAVMESHIPDGTQLPAGWALQDPQDYLEAMDWIVWQLTGKLTASACAMGYKAFHFRGKFPSKDFFKALDPRMENFVEEKFPNTILPIGARAGGLTEEMAVAMHLNPGTPVGTPIIDAHASIPGGGVGAPGEMMIIMGTSACHLMLSETDNKVPGVQGIVKDGIMPGFYGIEAGQACVGDHFAWVVDNCMPLEYTMEAREKGISKHQYLTQKLEGYKAGKSGLYADYLTLHEYFGKGGNDVMRRLNKLRRQ